VQFSFSITDLKKSVPGAAALAGLDGDALIAKLRAVLGHAAEDAEVTVDGESILPTHALFSGDRSRPIMCGAVVLTPSLRVDHAEALAF